MGKLICLLYLLFSLPAFAEGDSTLHLQITTTISGSYSNFYTDNLQNIYLISSAANGIKKLNNSGDSIAVFNNSTRYGKLYSLDVSNPLKVLVYYKDFSTIILLDRFLTTRTAIDLRKLGITQVKTITQSYDGNIWLYDEAEGKLKKIDENGNLLFESADLRLVFNDSLNPVKIIDNNTQLYLYDSKAGWLIFDYYAGFKKQLLLPGWKDVSVNDNVLSGRDSTHFLYASQSDIDFHKWSSNIAFDSIIKTQWQGNKLYILTKNGVSIYSVIQ